MYPITNKIMTAMLMFMRFNIYKSAKMEEDAGNYLYNLVGILVHAGVAQGGHYYSYIRDRGRNAYQGGDKKSQVDGGSNSNGSGLGFIEGLERGVSAGASSVGSEGIEEGKVKGVVGEGGATLDLPPPSF